MGKSWAGGDDDKVTFSPQPEPSATFTGPHTAPPQQHLAHCGNLTPTCGYLMMVCGPPLPPPLDWCQYILISIFSFFFFFWSTIDLQCCVSFRCAAKWIYCTYTYIHSFLDSFHMLAITQYWVEFPVLYSRSLLVIYFIYSSVYMSVPVSQFIPPLFFCVVSPALSSHSTNDHWMNERMNKWREKWSVTIGVDLIKEF